MAPASSELVILSSFQHSHVLIGGLWKFLTAKHRVDDISWSGGLLKAHQLVLDVFLPAERALNGVARSDEVLCYLKPLMEFMYKGTVTVQRDELDGLLFLAKEVGFQLLVDAIFMSGAGQVKVESSDIQIMGMTDVNSCVEMDGETQPKFPANSGPRISGGDKVKVEAEESQGTDMAAVNSFADMNGKPQLKITEISDPARSGGDQVTVESEAPQGTSIADEDTCTEMGGENRPKIPVDSDPTRFGGDQFKVEAEKAPGTGITDANCCVKMDDESQPKVPVNSGPRRSGERQVKGITNVNSCTGMDSERQPGISVSTAQMRSCAQSVMVRRKPTRALAPLEPKMDVDSDSGKDKNLNSSTPVSNVLFEEIQVCVPVGLKLEPTPTEKKATSEECMFQEFGYGDPDNSCRNANKDNSRMAAAYVEDKPFQCDRCSETFRFSYLLKMHVNDVHGGPPDHGRYFCSLCEERFSTGNALDTHMATHQDLGTFRCTHCSQAYSQNKFLVAHLLRAHCIRQPPVTVVPTACNVCRWKCKDRARLLDHQRSHGQVGSYTCRHCDRVFEQHTGVTSHVACVHNIRTYSQRLVCDVCRKLFKDPRKLKKHRQLHGPERPYECPHCCKGFRLASSRDYHVKHNHDT